MTRSQSVSMLWGNAMSPYRIASLCVVIAAASVQGCELNEEASPPAAPENTMVPPPPPIGSPQPEAPAALPPEGAAAPNAPSYASGEVTIGSDSEGYEDDDPAALSDFHSALDPSGTWVQDGRYGTVWVPSPTVVGPDFQPYVSAGHWTYDDDWVWASDYDWGWAPFHYGRWVWIEGRGWSWIPGRVYRGAWVAWGIDDGYSYVGWAPMPPSFVWFGGVAVTFPVYVAPHWVYCPRGEVFSPMVRTRILAGAAAGPIAGRVHPYVLATPGVGFGPPPQRLGFQAAQVPRPAAGSGVVRAQQFARPATAQPLGARPPTRMQTPVTEVRPTAARPLGRVPTPMAEVPPAGAWVHAPRTVGATPSAASAPARPSGVATPGAARVQVTPGRAAPSAPAAPVRSGGRSSPARAGGGAHHR